MGRNTISVLRTFMFIAATLYISGCANGPSSTKSLPGGGLSAASNAASGPLLGTWWDPSLKGLRTIYGVVGAAHQGPPSFNDGTYTGAATCMRKNIALLTQASGSLISETLPDGAPVVIAGNTGPKSSIVFSPSCTTSLVYTPGSVSALLVQGLLTTPTATSMTLSAGTFSSVVADSGSVLMAVPAANGGTAIQLFTNSTSTLQPMTTLSGFGGMTFLPGSDSALVADASTNILTKISLVSGTVNLTPIATGANGISKPTAIEASADGRFVAVANLEDSSVLRLDLTGQSPPVKNICRCSPSRLEPLAGNFAFRINEPGAGTVWAFDGGAAEPKLLFLPSDQTGQLISMTKGARR